MERAHATVVGTFHYGQRHNYVRPIDDRIKMDVIIAEGDEVGTEPSEAASRIEVDRVIGSEASRRPWEDLGGPGGRLRDHRLAYLPPRIRVAAWSRFFGYEDDFGVDVEIIIRKHHLPHHFPQSVIAEAQAIPSAIRPAEVLHAP